MRAGTATRLKKCQNFIEKDEKLQLPVTPQSHSATSWESQFEGVPGDNIKLANDGQ